jgi:hypothetical protein
VRYLCNEKALVQLICHCRDCQRASGGAFAALLVVPSDRLTFNGTELEYYDTQADSGRTLRREFCGQCGSPVSVGWPGASSVAFLHAGSLDKPDEFNPSCELWVSRAPTWHQLHPNTVKFDEGASEQAIGAPIAEYFARRQ